MLSCARLGDEKGIGAGELSSPTVGRGDLRVQHTDILALLRPHFCVWPAAWLTQLSAVAVTSGTVIAFASWLRLVCSNALRLLSNICLQEKVRGEVLRNKMMLNVVTAIKKLSKDVDVCFYGFLFLEKMTLHSELLQLDAGV